MAASNPNFARLFQVQARWCHLLGGAFTGALLARAADEIEAGGRLRDFLHSLPESTRQGGLPLRFAAALHYAVLKGKAPEALASFYQPPREGRGALWGEVEKFLHNHPQFFTRFMAHPPQTNEMMRAAVLLGGFLRAGQKTGLPLHVCEIGASAGLLLNWDRFFYQFTSGKQHCWGDKQAAIHLAPQWQGQVPDLDFTPVIAQRQACDAAPLDAGNQEHQLRLQAYVWPEQHTRLARLRKGLALAKQQGHKVEKMDAEDFIARTLATRDVSQTLVIYHAIVWPYLPKAKREAITKRITQAGEEGGAPLVWLSFEEGKYFARHKEAGNYVELCWRFWDEAGRHEEQVLAHSGGHGDPILWRG